MLPAPKQSLDPRLGPIRVLTVDDSPLFRTILRQAFGGLPGVRLVGTGEDGLEALKLVEELRPDLMTLDLEMPRLDGLSTLKELRLRDLKVRTIVVSGLNRRGADKTMQALELGAEDFITKPDSSVKGDRVEHLREQLRSMIVRGRAPAPWQLPKPPVQALPRPNPVVPSGPRVPATGHSVVLVAVSTGGPRALNEMVQGLPPDFLGPVLIVQHMPPLFTESLAERLDKSSHLKAAEARDNEPIKQGRIYLAPGGYHMEVHASPTGEACIKLHEGPRVNGCRPAADHLFVSAARHYGSRCLGVVMTGMGCDGTLGARAILQAGGSCIGQDESTCAVFGMPRMAAEEGLLEGLYPLPCLAHEINKRTRR